MSKEVIPVDKVIHTLPNNDGVFTEEEYDFWNTNNRYSGLLHVLGGIHDRQPTNQVENMPEDGEVLPNWESDTGDFWKAVLLIVIIGVIFSCIISIWDTLPPSIQILPGLWFNK